ncbi:MAG: histidine phosphatase family protein [Desulfobacula sp.]|uniref:histidine phosphatase family protein n=1 Tax=Desulfobacula sp. TaxID=2593537 RepID=UPI001D58F607|nr:histidine phosphatase family protein [Desulfobacula sp.]MBT3484190.1 histidine phosphatase family protein [Desulfobacula sp.]MBT3803696.1 histidine phosphatase family protein [Desulfobacula sp.]MBT4024401.1 histidine phosphatase family protein [Desulfobacula sp.]MBT4198442.1 histidine phosphatase family protein [Desulfobacula sp.]
MSCRLILVSHALTQWNIEGRIQGHTDVPLNNEGRTMAQCLAKRLARETIHAVYASDLKRSVQTAKPTAEQKSLEIILDIRLREGRSINQERSDTYPTLPFSREVETETDLYQRMTAALSDIARSHDGQTVLVISHGGSIEVFINHFLEKTREILIRYQGIRMALNRLRYDSGRWQCIRLNEDDFFRK